ncbi:MAG: beta-galactosidase [Fimbriimonadaceae bacterium]|nr:beta-galactosidase [Fimbriimonadaceae bacterium]
MQNGDFAQAGPGGAPAGWSCDPQAARRQPVGAGWELVSRPGAYVLAAQELTLQAAAVYTLTLTVRGDAAGRAGALLLQGAGRETYLLWDQPVDAAPRTLTRVFTAPAAAVRLLLYNVARTGEVAYRQVTLEPGRPSWPVVRELRFPALHSPSGPPPETPHVPWLRPLPGGPLRAVAALAEYRAAREWLELAQRVELDLDLLNVAGDDLASATAERVQERLKRGQVDVLLVNARLPEVLRRCAAERLAEGGGVVLFEGRARREELPAELVWRDVAADHALLRDLPWEQLAAGLRPSVQIAEPAAGRAVRLRWDPAQVRLHGCWPVLLDSSDWEQRQFHYWEYPLALAARAVAWAGGRLGEGRLRLAEGRLQATGLPPRTRCEVRPRSLREVRCGEPDRQFEASQVVLGEPWQPADAWSAGPALLAVRALDARGAVLASAALPWPRRAPGELQAVAVTPAVAQPGETVRVTVEVAATGPTVLQVSLNDAHQRRYAAATARLAGAGQATVELPLARSSTALSKVAVLLTTPAGRELDYGWRNVVVPALNHQAAWAEWQVTGWGEQAPPALSQQFNARLREIGWNGKFEGDSYGALEAGLFPSRSAGLPGLYPAAPRPDGVRAAGCLSDPDLLARTDQRIAERLQRWGRYGIVAWSLGDELALTHDDQIDEVDRSETAVAAYRQWLRQQYGHLAALNRQWGTTHESWEDIQPSLSAAVRGSQNYAPFVDFREFMTEAWLRVLRHGTQALREQAAPARVGHTNTFGLNPFNGADYGRLASAVGFTWGQEYSEAIKADAQKAVYALWRSFVPEGFPNLGWIGYQPREAAVRYEPWWLALHGSRGVSYFAACAVDAEHNDSWALVPPTLAPARYGELVRETLAPLVGGVGALLNASTPEPPTVGLVWSYPSVLSSWCDSTWAQPVPPAQPPFDSYGAIWWSALQMRHLLEEAGLPYAYVSPQQIAADPTVLGRYELLYLPLTSALDEATVTALCAWREAGGTLVADLHLAARDEHGTLWPEGRQLARLSGLRAVGRPVWEPLKLQVSTGFGAPSLAVAGYGWQELQPLPGEEVLPLGRTAAGQPAVWLRPSGEGTSIVLGSILAGDDPGALQLIRSYASRGPRPRTLLLERADGGSGPTAVELQRRFLDGAELLGLSRDWRRVAAGERTPPAVRLRLGRRAWVGELRAGRPLATWTDTVELALGPGDARLLAVLPYEPRGVEVSLPERVRAGEDLRVTAQVQASAAPATHFLRIELRGPDGVLRPAYTRQVQAPQGRWSGSLPLALNDPPGTWEVRVRDVLGCRSASRTWQLVVP